MFIPTDDAKRIRRSNLPEFPSQNIPAKQNSYLKNQTAKPFCQQQVVQFRPLM